MNGAPPGVVPSTRAQAQRVLAGQLGSAAEARWVVDHVLGRGPSGTPVDAAGWATLAGLADRRLAGEPLQYVLGSWAFRHLELAVDPRALIPRPETEQVVEVALAELRRLALVGRGTAGRRAGWPVVVDLGTGTGAIALSMATEGGARVWATDRDPAALALAGENLDRLLANHPGPAGSVGAAGSAGPLGAVAFCPGDWFDALPGELRGRVDLVVSNPPYVAEGEWGDLDPEVRREPRQALVAAAGSDGTPGLADVESVLRGAFEWLGRPGAVVVELAPHQAGPAAALATGIGFAEVRVERDLAGRDRAVVGRA